MPLFVKQSEPSGNISFRRFDGQTEDEVKANMKSCNPAPFVFIEQAEYDAGIEAIENARAKKMGLNS